MISQAPTGLARPLPVALRGWLQEGLYPGRRRRREWLERGLHCPKLVCPPRRITMEHRRGGWVSSKATAPERVVIAVDPHKASWTAAVVGPGLAPLATVRVPVSAQGY